MDAKDIKDTKEENSNILKHNPFDYSIRGLDICGICKLKFNIGDRIPRI